MFQRRFLAQTLTQPKADSFSERCRSFFLLFFAFYHWSNTGQVPKRGASLSVMQNLKSIRYKNGYLALLQEMYQVQVGTECD